MNKRKKRCLYPGLGRCALKTLLIEVLTEIYWSLIEKKIRLEQCLDI